MQFPLSWWQIFEKVNSFARALLPFRRCLATLLPALPSPFSGKYVVSIMVPLSFVSVTVPGGCRSQGCHGYPTRSAPVLEAPPSFQAPSPSSSIVDEFNYKTSLLKKVLMNRSLFGLLIQTTFWNTGRDQILQFIEQANNHHASKC